MYEFNKVGRIEYSDTMIAQHDPLTLRRVSAYNTIYLKELEEDISRAIKKLTRNKINLAKSLAKDLTMVRFVLKRRNK